MKLSRRDFLATSSVALGTVSQGFGAYDTTWSARGTPEGTIQAAYEELTAKG